MAKLIEMRFTEGPWDGQELGGQPPPPVEWFAVTGGHYEFQGTVPPRSAAYETRAFYEWMPDEKTGGEDER
jgi:hypothetical protein